MRAMIWKISHINIQYQLILLEIQLEICESYIVHSICMRDVNLIISVPSDNLAPTRVKLSVDPKLAIKFRNISQFIYKWFISHLSHNLIYMAD